MFHLQQQRFPGVIPGIIPPGVPPSHPFLRLFPQITPEMALGLPQANVQYINNVTSLQNIQVDANYLSNIFGVPISTELQNIVEFIHLNGDYQERTWNFTIALNTAEMKYLNITYTSNNSNLNWSLIHASVAVPQLYTQQRVAKQKWAGDVGKIFGKKKTVYETINIPRGLTPNELQIVTNHLTKAIQSHPNFVGTPLLM